MSADPTAGAGAGVHAEVAARPPASLPAGWSSCAPGRDAEGRELHPADDAAHVDVLVLPTPSPAEVAAASAEGWRLLVELAHGAVAWVRAVACRPPEPGAPVRVLPRAPLVVAPDLGFLPVTAVRRSTATAPRSTPTDGARGR